MALHHGPTFARSGCVPLQGWPPLSLCFANRCGWLGLAQHHSPHVLTTTCRFPQLFLALPGGKKRLLLDQEPGSASRPEQGKPGIVSPPVLTCPLEACPPKAPHKAWPCVSTGDFRDAGEGLCSHCPGKTSDAGWTTCPNIAARTVASLRWIQGVQPDCRRQNA